MNVTKIENHFCPACGRVEIVEVEYAAQTMADGTTERVLLSAMCRYKHEVPLT